MVGLKAVGPLTVLLVIASAVSAHPGGLDKNGGHYNRKTGEYHYHRKVEPAPVDPPPPAEPKRESPPTKKPKASVPPTAAVEKVITGKVVSITDGDTFKLLDSSKEQHVIRLQGIDAPEDKQAFGTKSKTALGDKIHEKEVVVRWKSRDAYGRILGEVYLGDRHINLEMVKEGWAWHFKRYSKSAELADAEKEAREGKAGLWGDPKPVPPWEFRDARKLEKARN